MAGDVLQLAIEEVRKSRDPQKRERAKAWLLSPGARLLFDSLLETDVDLKAWVLAGCPELGNH